MPGVRPQSLYNATAASGPGGVAALRKGLRFSSRCSWKCTAILLMLTSCVLAAALAYLVGKPPSNPGQQDPVTLSTTRARRLLFISLRNPVRL